MRIEPGRPTDAPPFGTIYVVRTTGANGHFQAITNSTVGVIGAWMHLRADFTSQTSDVHSRLDNLSKHEAGHGFGLLNGSQFAPPSVMSQNSIVNGNFVITSCDINGHNRVYCPTPLPTPTPTPSPTPIPGGCNSVPNFILFPTNGCASGFMSLNGTCGRSEAFMQQCFQSGDYDFDSCSCTGGCGWDGSCSPIVVDVFGDGFSLTNAGDGIDFDINNDGSLERHSWTSMDSDDAWLALDRNNNGVIDTGKELFGSVSPQEPLATGEEWNGFRSLAIYDGPGYGGNGDGKISAPDAIFNRLKLWRDTNHNGVSESCELFTLPELGLQSIDLDYRQSGSVDEHGNAFRYRSKVFGVNGSQLGRWAFDVFLVVQQP